MRTRRLFAFGLAAALLVAGLPGIVEAQPPGKCPNLPKGQGVGSSKDQCPGTFESVYLLLDKCESFWGQQRLWVIPDDALLDLKNGPYRVAWIVTNRKGYDWTIERKSSASGTDILPDAKKIDQAAADAFFSAEPQNAKGGDLWQYRVVVKKPNGQPCAEIDPQIRIKDDPPPPPPPAPPGGRR